MATTLLRTRVDRSRAKAAQEILARLGIKPSDAVNMLFAQIVSRRGLPFAVEEDYALTEYGMNQQAMAEAQQRIQSAVQRERRAKKNVKVASPDDLR